MPKRKAQRGIDDYLRERKEDIANAFGSKPKPSGPKPKPVTRPNSGVRQNVHNMATKGTGRYAMPKKRKKA